ncbi:MAG: glycosyltransferase family 39 protein [Bacteroidetes bacterium]|nr:glycosyltransferase family 39 protein [Bacteroidota bacterium]
MRNLSSIIILVLIVLAAFIIRIYTLDKFGIHGDEKISITNATGIAFIGPSSYATDSFNSSHYWQKNTVREVIKQNLEIDRGNTMLYTVMLHFWIEAFGTSDFSVRLLSVLFDLFNLLLVFLITLALRFKKRIALLAMALCALHPLLVEWSHIARGYTAATTFALLSTYFFIRIIQGEEKSKFRAIYIWYGLTLLAAALTHYFTIYVVIGHVAYSLFYFRNKKTFYRFFISYFIFLGGFLFWLDQGGMEGLRNMNERSSHYEQETNENPNLFAEELTSYLMFQASTRQFLPYSGNYFTRFGIKLRYIAPLLLIPLLLLFIGFTNAYPGKRMKLLLLFLILGPIVQSILLAIFSGHTISFYPKYVIFSAPLFSMLYAIAFFHLFKMQRWMKLLGFSLIGSQIIIMAYSITGIYIDANTWRTNPREKNVHYQVSKEIIKRYLPGDTIIYFGWTDALMTNLYLRKHKEIIQKVNQNQAPNTVFLKSNGHLILLTTFENSSNAY